jgi:hypothetical protein
LLREPKGAGELVHDRSGPLLPLRLTARPGSTATAAIFETSPADGAPKVRVEITQCGPHGADLEFSIKVERAIIETTWLCGGRSGGSTALQTRFSLTDGVHGRRKVSTEQTWECQGEQLKTP